MAFTLYSAAGSPAVLEHHLEERFFKNSGWGTEQGLDCSPHTVGTHTGGVVHHHLRSDFPFAEVGAEGTGRYPAAGSLVSTLDLQAWDPAVSSLSPP
ncbi:hypothetical protein A6R68_04655 [Neotoma lepida]|uniref:Uncharacterized protein n=1 Tax=Neotoma lepida TaxID=56216 RepID=A0A1A6GKL4_NEOLE|nr:hypothetical protein A6R68_04655 [Neotoma lepida]